MAPAKKAAKKATKKSPAKKAAKKATKKSPAKKTAKKTTKKAAKKTAKKAGERGSVVVASKVKAAIASGNLRMDSTLVDAVNDRVNDMLAAAVQRARDNRRGTVRPYDL